MIRCTIDGRSVACEPGTTVMSAARSAGIEIPGLCHLEELRQPTTCMLCVVESSTTDGLIPACTAAVTDGSAYLTATERVLAARRGALEMLLVEHNADCVAPCVRACPAGLDIPRMIRRIAAGQLDGAMAIVLERIPFPSILGRVCSAPCESVCRRHAFDGAVAICLLKRAVGDAAAVHRERDNSTEDTAHRTGPANDTGEKARRAVVIGAGIAGMTVAWTLASSGWTVTVFEARATAWGGLADESVRERLPNEVLTAEQRRVEALGVEIRLDSAVQGRDRLTQLTDSYDAVVVAAGRNSADLAADAQEESLSGPASTTASPVASGAGPPNLYFVVPPRRGANDTSYDPDHYRNGSPRAAATVGRATATAKRIDSDVRCFSRDDSTAHTGHRFSSRRHDKYDSKTRDERYAPFSPVGLSVEEAIAESERCLGCDCASAEDCELRALADQLDVHPSVSRTRSYADGVRREELRSIRAPYGDRTLVLEPEKCIRCGRCVALSARAGDDPGLVLLGRGRNSRITVPLGVPLDQALAQSAETCVRFCPTGALTLRSHEW